MASEADLIDVIIKVQREASKRHLLMAVQTAQRTNVIMRNSCKHLARQ